MTTMYCNTCGEKAVIRMRQHRLSLCPEHYLSWVVDQTQRFIKNYQMFSPEDWILVAVSGGKDSLGLWDVLWRLGYQTEGLYLHLGIEGDDHYSDKSLKYAAQFAQSRGLNLHVVNVEQMHGQAVPGLAKITRRGRGKPCSVCGMVKRHDMNRTAVELGFDVLATAHNLDDEAAFLYGNVMGWNIRQMRRQSVVLPEKPGLTRKVKPFFRFTERETAAYAFLRGIEYIEEECPFAAGTKQIDYKNLLNQMEEVQPGAKLRFVLGFQQARDEGFFPPETFEADGLKLRPCRSCGQPTSSEGLCSLCRLVSQLVPRD